MLLTLPRLARVLTLPLLPMLLAACGSASPLFKPTPAPAIPPLPAQARQTDSATHSQRAQTSIEAWLQPQTAPLQPGSPASAPTTR